MKGIHRKNTEIQRKDAQWKDTLRLVSEWPRNATAVKFCKTTGHDSRKKHITVSDSSYSYEPM